MRSNRAAATILSATSLSAILVACAACDSSRVPGNGTVMVPMRDGVELATDLYFPDDEPAPYPVILVRTPYNKAFLENYGQYFSRSGYAVAIQDVRGRWGSGGEWEPFVHEGEDGYDTVEWLAAREWSTGKVGMAGGSYSGSAQFAAAVRRPPHLTTIVPSVTPAMPFRNLPYEGGALLLGWAIRWTDIVENARSGAELQRMLERSVSDDWTSALDHLPVIDLDRSVVGSDVSYWRAWVRHNTDDGYWQSVHYLDELASVDIPVLLQSGWFDGGTRGTRLAFERLRDGNNDNVWMIVGPWVHSDRGTRYVEGIDMGAGAEMDLMALYRRWFDHWLKGDDNGIAQEPRVRLYLMGANRWLNGEQYPLPEVTPERFYLIPGDDGGAGGLRREPAPAGYPHSEYAYDPGDPTPSFYAYAKRGALLDYARQTRDRGDLLVFETPPLTEEMHVAGPLSVTLYASSSAVDTDWVATLYAITETGVPRFIGVTFGVLRAQFRNSMAEPDPIEPGRVYAYDLDLGHTAATIQKGQRLRLEIASAAFPEYSRNLNTGEPSELGTEFLVAHQRVYHDANHASFLQLPVLSNRERR